MQIDEIATLVQRGPVHPAPSFLLGTNISPSLPTKVHCFSDSLHSSLSASGRWRQFSTERDPRCGVWSRRKGFNANSKLRSQQGCETTPLSDALLGPGGTSTTLSGHSPARTQPWVQMARDLEPQGEDFLGQQSLPWS